MRFVWSAILSGSLLAATPALTLADPAPASSTVHYASRFRVNGEVAFPRIYTLPLLSQLPATKLDVFFYTGAGPVNATYTGVLLWDLLGISGVITDSTIKNDILRKEVVVKGSDGYETIISLGEIAPEFGGQQVIVAYAQNGVPFDATTGFAKLIVPGDKAGGRAVSTIVEIRVTGVN